MKRRTASWTGWALGASLVLLFVGCFSPTSSGLQGTRAEPRYVQPNKTKPGFVAMAMAPLWIDSDAWTDDQFSRELETVKAMGVQRISVDVWWGKVAQWDTPANPGAWTFTWDYYDQIFKKIIQSGLKVVPILSFHAAGKSGGSPGDYVDIGLPEGLFKKHVGEAVTIVDPDTAQLMSFTITSEDQLKYKSEQGKVYDGVPSLWADSVLRPDYEAFVRAFSAWYAPLRTDIPEIDVSLGPAGELRYPSYDNQDDNPNKGLDPGYFTNAWPTRGTLQAYSDLAIADYQWSMKLFFYGGKTIQDLESDYAAQLPGFSVGSFNKLQPPNPWVDTPVPQKVDAFDGSQGKPFYLSSSRWYQFLWWYHFRLKEHGKTMLDNTTTWLGRTWAETEIGYKIPGVHWHAGPGSPMRRAAEVTAGLIRVDNLVGSETSGFNPNADPNFDHPHFYQDLVAIANDQGGKPNKRVLYFTALELPDNNPDHYSFAKSIVQRVGQHAQALGVTLRGENALGSVSGDYFNDNSNAVGSAGWFHIDDALQHFGYSGINILRVGSAGWGNGGVIKNDLKVDAVGHAGTDDQQLYANLIQQFRVPNPATDLTIHTGELGWPAMANRQMWAEVYSGVGTPSVAKIPSYYQLLAGRDYHTYTLFDAANILPGTLMYKFYQTDGATFDWESGSLAPGQTLATTLGGKVYFQNLQQAQQHTPQLVP